MSDDIESRVQKFCDAHQATIKFAIKNNIVELGNRMLGDDGMKRFKNGMRDLISTIDNSEHPAVGYEALQKIITGVTLVFCRRGLRRDSKDRHHQTTGLGGRENQREIQAGRS